MKSLPLCAMRKVLVPTAFTLVLGISLIRCPSCRRDSRDLSTASSVRLLLSSSPDAIRTMSLIRSIIRTWPSSSFATTMWKLFDPRSTAAKVSLMGELMLYNQIPVVLSEKYVEQSPFNPAPARQVRLVQRRSGRFRPSPGGPRPQGCSPRGEVDEKKRRRAGDHPVFTGRAHPGNTGSGQ